jgi:hypothetical protein
MKNINSMPRVFRNYGPSLTELFNAVMAPIFAVAGPTDDRDQDRSMIRQLNSRNREVAYSIPSLELAIAGMIVDDVPLHIRRGQLAEMLSIDLLTIDLSRPGGIVDCEVELYASSRAVKHSVPNLAMWLGAAGEVAFVSEISNDGIDFWKPAVLLTARGLVITDTNPFADEADRLPGIRRAIEAANDARRKAEMADARFVGWMN